MVHLADYSSHWATLLRKAPRRSERAFPRWHTGATAVIDLAVPGRPIRSLVAEDRSAEGVRDRTGPDP